jgi:hypothetical protein
MKMLYFWTDSVSFHSTFHAFSGFENVSERQTLHWRITVHGDCECTLLRTEKFCCVVLARDTPE